MDLMQLDASQHLWCACTAFISTRKNDCSKKHSHMRLVQTSSRIAWVSLTCHPSQFVGGWDSMHCSTCVGDTPCACLESNVHGSMHCTGIVASAQMVAGNREEGFRRGVAFATHVCTWNGTTDCLHGAFALATGLWHF